MVDVGFDAPTHLDTDIVHPPGTLEFAGITPPAMSTLAIETHLAEKLHAYSRPYAEGRQSSRVKDLVDIVLIGMAFELRAGNCKVAPVSSFSSRNTHAVPTHLGSPPSAWSDTYPDLARSVSLDPDITVGYAFAASLFDPLLAGNLRESATWNSSMGKWQPG